MRIQRSKVLGTLILSLCLFHTVEPPTVSLRTLHSTNPVTPQLPFAGGEVQVTRRSNSTIADNANMNVKGCPVLKISGPGPTEADCNAILTYELSVEGCVDQQLSYDWAVTPGKLVSGQGTRKVTIDTTGIKEKAFTLTVIVGGLPGECTRGVSHSMICNKSEQ
jgi:hypothetical protein